jgi:paraquat-inducible protein B
MKPSPTAIGLFLLGGLALGIAVAVVVGSGLFRGHLRAVAYFEANVQGLVPGAMVDFRGVPVGHVAEVRLEVDLRKRTAVIPVILDIDPRAWGYVGGGGRGETIAQAVADGLRARLEMQSFVTNMMLVELDFMPETAGFVFAPNVAGLPEIPTVKSQIEQIKNLLTGIPLREIADSLNRATHDLDRLLSTPELPDLLRNLASAAANTNTLVVNLNGDRARLMAELHNTLASFDKVATDLQALSGDTRKTIKNLNEVTTAQLRAALKAAQGSLDQMQRAFTEAANMLSPYSPERTQISRILDTVQSTMQSLREFAGEVRRKPNALIFGN